MNYDEYFDTYEQTVKIIRETVPNSSKSLNNSCNNNSNKPLQEVVCEK